MRIRLANLPARDQKLNCIKAARYAFADGDNKGYGGMGLKEAKDFVEDAIEEQGSVITLEGEMRRSDCNGEELTISAIREYVVGNGSNVSSNSGCNLIKAEVAEVLDTIKIESDGSQVFNVPNTEEGRRFLDKAAKYLNRPQFGIVKRGRGTRKFAGDQASIPLKDSEWIALYVKGDKASSICPMKASSMQFDIDKLRNEVDGLNAELLIKANSNSHLERDVKSLKAELRLAVQEKADLANERDEAEAYATRIEADLNEERKRFGSATAQMGEMIQEQERAENGGINIRLIMDGKTIVIRGASSVDIENGMS
jgi:hypothetical protein